MPARSKAEYKLMENVAAGKRKVKGLTKKAAAEYIKGQSPKKLPKRAKKK